MWFTNKLVPFDFNWFILYSCYPVVPWSEFVMHSTVDAWNETSTTWQTANRPNISENTTTLLLKRGFWMGFKSSPFQISFLTVVVLAALSNVLVLVGFRLAGRSKMNVSSIYIANHTTLEQLPFSQHRLERNL